MSISLKKGQKVSLSKESGERLSNVIVGLGWDEAPVKKKLFGPKPEPIDCDASAFALIGGKIVDKSDIVYFGHLTHKTNCIVHMGDNLTGEGNGDDEQIMIDLAMLPPEYDKIIIVVNIFQARARNQHFGMIQNAYIRIEDGMTHKEFCRYNLTDDYSGSTALVFGEVYRRGNEWKFNAIGQGTTDNSIDELAKKYK